MTAGLRIPRHSDPWDLETDTQNSAFLAFQQLSSESWPEFSGAIIRQAGDKLARAEVSVACSAWVTATWG